MLQNRTAKILKVLVDEYISTAMPVASENVALKSGLKVSSATVRNEMADLAGAGYILRPHISAGGVPSDKGYRYYVQSLGEMAGLGPSVQHAIRQNFDRVVGDRRGWARLAAAFLARAVENLVVVTLPRAVHPARLRDLKMVHLQESGALLIVVLQEAQFRQQVIPLDYSMDEEELLKASNMLTAAFEGRTWTEIQSYLTSFSPFEERVKEITVALMQEEEGAQLVEHRIDGLRHLLNQPEFLAGQWARRVAEVVEQETLVHICLEDAPAPGEVRVVIGSENKQEALKQFSVVLCQYGLPGEIGGIVGVIGPTRMSYPTTIGNVRFLSSFLTGLLKGTHDR